jgi:signal transduction histidine kinase
VGLGLLGMRERVEALHGKFEVAAAPERGVRIMIFIPTQTASGEGAS